MSCCGHCRGIEKEFGRRTARRELRRYRRRGPSRTTRILLDALRRQGIAGCTLLDVGGGIGALHHELLADGVADATHVDASPAYLEAARREAERRGHADRVHFFHGDFVELAPELAPADIVTLDRVICCYPDMERLLGGSAAKAGRWLGLVYPRDAWWIRLGFPLPNLYFRVRGSPFRVFLHAPAAVDALMRGRGFARRFEHETVFWRIEVHERVGSLASDPAQSRSSDTPR